MRTSVVTPYAAYLRVYEPLAAFSNAEKTVWAQYVDTGEALDPRSAMIDERRRSLMGLLATPPILAPPAESRDAFVLPLDGGVFICPLETRLRAWLALAEFLPEAPQSLSESIAPPLIIEQTVADYERWRERAPDQRLVPHILTNPWFVPLRWFIPFVHDERTVWVGTTAEPRALFFRTPMVEARRRVARARRVLERTVEDGPIVAGVLDLGRWLEEFHPHAWVELDYGGLVHLIDDARLAADCSAADVADALSALAADDPRAAAEAYARLMERWRTVQALGHAN